MATTNNSGGPVAIRGYLVQTLVALLDIAQAEPAFSELTLEPAHEHEQFPSFPRSRVGMHSACKI